MTRRHLFAALLPLALVRRVRASDVPGISIRGKLVQSGDPKPALEVEGGKRIALHGDEPTMLVLNDVRLKGADLEAIGHFNDPDHFEVDRIHTRALFVHKGGKRLMVTYWCDVCYIRTYAPGPCWCCQKYTDLDLIEHEDHDH